MNPELLQNLIPLNSLNSQAIKLLAEEAKPEHLHAGITLFVQGDNDIHTIYLLSGEVTLSAADASRTLLIIGGTESARYPLAQLKPRKYTGLAQTPVSIVRFESKLIDRFLCWDQMKSYEVAEFDTGQDLDWMMNLLRSKAFCKVPPTNANALLARFQPIHVKAGQVIVRQGEPGDYYYVVKSGEADVLRRNEKTHKVSIVDRLKEGEGFGEYALLMDKPRSATVVMATDGVLMRLFRKDFYELLCEPLVDLLELPEAQALVKEGAGLLDVRLEEEFANGTIKGSVNLPLYLLRAKANELDPDRRYIVFCQTGSRSCAAAFLLTQYGYQASVLRGGLDGLQRSG